VLVFEEIDDVVVDGDLEVEVFEVRIEELAELPVGVQPAVGFIVDTFLDLRPVDTVSYAFLHLAIELALPVLVE
jgi:hypothetical protein